MKTECSDHGACPSVALSQSEIEARMKLVNPEWQLVSGSPNKISREFKFNSYLAGLDFTNKVAAVAEKMNHHPDIFLAYKKVRVDYWTHNAEGLSEMDFQAAAELDQLINN